ncbi:MAG: helix-turn-helix transcriptional regulator [Deltaproteobacteria bacterium]|nr:helix-turn-helix transcriptional regulator [Deltaproteobacteria bacterium]
MRLRHVEDLGAAIRAERKAQRLTQARLAALAGVSPRFLIELEHGRPTVGLALTLRVLSTLGLDLQLTKRSGA